MSDDTKLLNPVDASPPAYSDVGHHNAKSNAIHIYTAAQPYRIEISVALEEVNLEYDFMAVHSSLYGKDEDRMDPHFKSLSPSGGPALTDMRPNGTQARIFGSGPVLEYLVSTYDTVNAVSFPPDSQSHLDMISWLHFAHQTVRPRHVQAAYYTRHGALECQPALAWSQGKLREAWQILEDHFRRNGCAWLVGDRCSVAGIAHWCWLYLSSWAGVRLDRFPLVAAWEQRMRSRPSSVKGCAIPQSNFLALWDLSLRDDLVMDLKAASARRKIYGKDRRGPQEPCLIQ